MSDRERLLRAALRAARAGDEGAAEERAWRVVAAASTAGVPARRRGHRRRALQVGLALALVALVVSPAGASVRHWVADRIEPGVPHARPVLSSLPGDGSLLVDSPQGSWVVRPDGAKHSLGDWSEASWSPHGLFAVVTKGHEVAAVTPGGTVRWALTRPGRVGKARWNGPDGYRIAYLSGDRLRVVSGAGTDDRGIARGVAWVAPAWKPGPGHVVAYATDRRTVRAVGADSGRAAFEAGGKGAGGKRAVISLQWADGELFVTRADAIQALDAAGRPTWTWAAPPGTSIRSAAAAPRDHRVAVVLHAGRAGQTSSLVLLARGRHRKVLFSGPGRFAPPRWSPDARWLLLPWPTADQWLFLHPGSGAEKLHAVANVAEQFSPGAPPGARFPSVAGWSHSR